MTNIEAELYEQFRIVESSGGFTVQRQFSVKKTKNILWLPLDYEIVKEWRDINDSGKVAIGGYDTPLTFDTLKEAREWIKDYLFTPKDTELIDGKYKIHKPY